MFDGFQPSPETRAQLRTSALLHRFITTLTIEFGENYFIAEHAAHALLTAIATWDGRDGVDRAALLAWLTNPSSLFNRHMVHVITDVSRISSNSQKAVWELLGNEKYLTLFADIYLELRAEGKIYNEYLRDTFQYSLTVALRQMAQEVAGVEALNYVAAWTELHIDYERRAASKIWLYEIGMGGIGVMRATHQLLRNQPDQVWSALALHMTRCPTAQEEALLRYLLAQPEDWLGSCDSLVQDVIHAPSVRGRQQALEVLLASVRQQVGAPIPLEQVRAMLRVFVPEYEQELDGQPLVSWRLFREINWLWLPNQEKLLGRAPSFAEARSFLYEAAQKVTAEGTPEYPELYRLLLLYRHEYVEIGTGASPAIQASSDREVRQAFQNAVERRLLLTCRGSCPMCLDDRSSDIEAPGLARLILNRSLLTEWVGHVRKQSTINLGAADALGSVVAPLRAIFESGAAVAYLRVVSGSLGSLCSTISYLTDAGLDSSIGMLYPLVTNIQTIYAHSPTDPPLVEVTVRPIA